MPERFRRPPDAASLAACLAEDLAQKLPEREQNLRMRSRILVACASQPATQVLRGAQAEWRQVFPGVSIRHLSINPAGSVQLALWRMESGARIPPHTHLLCEECLVVEGSVTQGDARYDAGDFLLAAAGSPHQTFYSAEGALLLIRGELPPARLVSPPENVPVSH